MRKEIECLARLFDVALEVDAMVDFLIEERIMSATELPHFRIEKDKALYLYTLISNQKKTEKVLLFDFEWTLLPIERIKVTLVTERNSKEFVYNANK